jgi:ABC-2 type transport system permease protein
MAAESTLVPVAEGGWSAGLGNLLRKELGGWWRTRRWLVQTVLWLVIVNGLVALVLASPSGREFDQYGVPSAVSVFALFSGLFVPIGVLIALQSSLVGEKQSGTAAWVLSKPVSRLAFLISKLLADSFGFLVTMIVIQGAVGYALLAASGIALSALGFVAGLGVLFANLLFFQALAMVLGAFSQRRGVVLGVSMLTLFALNQLSQMPALSFLPGRLPHQAAGLMIGRPLDAPWPLAIALALAVVFITASVWRFEREEF